jgi:hypothetical protein
MPGQTTSAPANTRLGVADAALRLRIGYSAALGMLLRGELEGERAGHRWVVFADSVDRVLASRDGAAGPRAA